MVPKLDHDPAPAHFVGDGAGRAGPREGIEDKIAWVGGKFQNAFDESFRLCRLENFIGLWHEVDDFLFRFLRIANVGVEPNGLRNDTLSDL